MEQLRSLTVIVNPEGLDPLIQFPELRTEERGRLGLSQDPSGRILQLWHEGLSSAEGNPKARALLYLGVRIQESRGSRGVHRPPSHNSKTVLSTFHFGPPSEA